MQDELVAKVLLDFHARREVQAAPYSEYLQILKAREEVIARFQPKFQRPDQLSASDFRDFLEFKHNQHWTGLQRPTRRVCDDMPKLRRALAFLFDENIDIGERLDTLTSKTEYSVDGLNKGILTPLLLVRYPEKYGVWNGKSAAALKALCGWPKFSRGMSVGGKYRILNEIYLQLVKATGFDLWTLDGLWHVINEVTKLEMDLSFACVEQEERDYFEGRLVPNSGYRTERSSAARNRCVKEKGFDCAVCGFNFFERYGTIGIGYIHVHHVEDLALSERERKVDVKTGLVPVCPNCHAMLHKGVKKSRSLEDLRKRLR